MNHTNKMRASSIIVIDVLILVLIVENICKARD